MPVTPFQLPNFLNAPIQRGLLPTPNLTKDYSGIADFIPRALEAYNNPFKMRHERMMNKEKYDEQVMKNALEKEFGPRTREAEIASKTAYANNLMNPWSPNALDIITAYRGETPEALEAVKKMRTDSGTRGLTPGQRSINAMPAPAREAYLANIRGIVGNNMTDPEIIQHTANGWTLDDFKDFGREEGIDVENAKPRFAPTTPNITAQQKRQIVSSGNEVLHDFKTKNYAPYVGTIGGYSWNAVKDHFKGDDDKLAGYYAARMIEEEDALQQVVKSGGNVNMHAVQNMVDKGMGNHKVIPALMTPEIYEKTQKKVMEVMRRVVDAENSKLSEFSTGVPSNQRTGASDEGEYKSKLGKSPDKTVERMYRNNKTGQVMSLSDDQARKKGLMK